MIGKLALSLPLILAAGVAAAAASPRASGETVIPFLSDISQIEWKAISNDSLYLRGGKGEWYVIRTSNNCSRLRSSLAISLEGSPGNQLDRHGAIWVQGVRCPVASIAPSDGPPKKSRRG